MRKLGTTLAVLGLATLGLAVPAASAQADARGVGCDSQWPGRDGYVRAWDGQDCQGAYLGGTEGNDPDWNVAGDGFTGASDRASSVMNSGYIGGRDVVAFYYFEGYQHGYTCLSPNELYADNLSDNSFTTGEVVNDNIRSHQWVTASACAAGSWLT